MSTPEIITGIDLKLAQVRIELNWNRFDSYRKDDGGIATYPQGYSHRATMDNSYVKKFD